MGSLNHIQDELRKLADDLNAGVVEARDFALVSRLIGLSHAALAALATNTLGLDSDLASPPKEPDNDPPF